MPRPVKVKHLKHPGWRVQPFVAWYDCWVGAYYDRKARRLYVMVPFFGIWIGHQ